MPNKPVEMQIERDGIAQNINVTPLPDEAGDGKIGVSPSLWHTLSRLW